MRKSFGFIKAAVLSATLIAGAAVVTIEPAQAFHGGWHHGGGWGGGGYWGGGPYWGYGPSYGPYYDDPYDDGGTIYIERPRHRHDCFVKRHRVHTHDGWRIRAVRYCYR